MERALGLSDEQLVLLGRRAALYYMEGTHQLAAPWFNAQASLVSANKELTQGAEARRTWVQLESESRQLKVKIMALLLWILAVILVISGIVAIVRKQLLWGIVLIVVGCLVGPGGTSVFT